MFSKELESLYKKKEKFIKDINEEIRIKSVEEGARKVRLHKEHLAKVQQWEADGRPPPVEIEPEPEPEPEPIPPIIIKKKEIPKKEEVLVETEAKIEAAKEAVVEAIEEVIYTVENMPDEYINEYEDETGKKAIWKGSITNGFKEFLNANNY